MVRNSLIAGVFAVASLSLSGCALYFEEPSDSDTWSYCDETGCWTCDDWGCWPSDGSGGDRGPGWSCSTDTDCAAGCYCNADNVCEEAGFCASDADCPSGFECDGRSSCVPEDSGPTTCEADTECPDGSYCDEATGECVGSWTCDPNGDGGECGPGFVCDDRGTCVPQPCSTNDDCMAGCYCDADSGECVETDTCDAEGNCPADGFVCDDRNTCVPGEEPTLVCQGEVTCDTIPPACPLGSTPAIDADTGCYTGDCLDNAECPDGNPCASNTEDQCLAAGECTAVYSGTNCTDPNGNACNANEANCTCETYSYAACEDASTQ